LGWTTWTVNANDLRSDARKLDISTPREEQDATTLDKSAMVRLLLLADGTIDAEGIFNDAANKSHATLKGVSTLSAPVTVAIGVSGQTLSMSMFWTDLKYSRSDDGSFTWTAPFVLADGTPPAWS
jgi:hypothetical protein